MHVCVSLSYLTAPCEKGCRDVGMRDEDAKRAHRVQGKGRIGKLGSIVEGVNEENEKYTFDTRKKRQRCLSHYEHSHVKMHLTKGEKERERER